MLVWLIMLVITIAVEIRLIAFLKIDFYSLNLSSFDKFIILLEIP